MGGISTLPVPGFGSFSAYPIPDDAPEGTPNTAGGPFRPPQWNTGEPQTIVFAPAADPAGTLLSDGTRTTGSPTQYVFDAVLRALHDQDLRMTEHPVQSGANVVDHAYLVPAVLSLEIGFSDAMDQFTAGMYSGASSKSVSAYQTFLALQQSRVPLQIKTRLRTYDNMLIASIRATDDNRTKFALRATITFKQIILATANTVPASARPDSTDSTSEGTKAPEAPSPSVSSTNGLTSEEKNQIEQYIHSVSTPWIQNIPVNVPGAGNWSSNPVTNLLPSH